MTGADLVPRLAALGLRLMSGDTAPPAALARVRRNVTRVDPDVLDQLAARIADVSDADVLAMFTGADSATDAAAAITQRPEVLAVLEPSPRLKRTSEARVAAIAYALGLALMRAETVRERHVVSA